MIKLNPYIGFKGNAREAMEFYKDAFGGELHITTFKDGGMGQDPAQADKIMHAILIVGPEMTLMSSDSQSPEANDTSRVEISLSGDSSDEKKLRGYFE